MRRNPKRISTVSLEDLFRYTYMYMYMYICIIYMFGIQTCMYIRTYMYIHVSLLYPCAGYMLTFDPSLREGRVWRRTHWMWRTLSGPTQYWLQVSGLWLWTHVLLYVSSLFHGMSGHVHTCMYGHVCNYMYVWANTCKSGCTFIHVYMCIIIITMYVRTCADVYTCMYMYSVSFRWKLLHILCGF